MLYCLSICKKSAEWLPTNEKREACAMAKKGTRAGKRHEWSSEGRYSLLVWQHHIGRVFSFDEWDTAVQLSYMFFVTGMGVTGWLTNPDQPWPQNSLRHLALQDPRPDGDPLLEAWDGWLAKDRVMEAWDEWLE